jgi:hypothetical protein
MCLVMARGSVAQQLLLEVRPVKDSFVLGEPVYVDVEVRNIGAEPIAVSADPFSLGLLIRVLPPGVDKPEVWSLGGNADVQELELMQLKPGDRFKDRGLISHYVGKCIFPAPGAYKGWGESAWLGIRAVSERVEVVVTEPAGVDAQAKDLFFSQPGRFFVHSGGYTFPSQRGMTPAVADFGRVVNQYPTSTYAPYAAYYLALAKSDPMLRYSLGPEQPSDPVPPDYTRAIELAQFAEARTEFPLKAEARLLQAECYFGLGDRQKANAVLQSIRSLPGLSERKRAEALMAKLIQPPQ